ncbi:TonB-dependent receptor domain-containing protein [Aliiglaciecola sp. M165]|uniref:TonB-dependent receptor domain-containing protein n=1 Tax=Aliiglaciecola sp. M165 TaxID=2593649 RepID=UPI00117E0584|nr:TonB-dependent receptor [Aliiglaciecola sp. M165]TRY30685.1 TonB-dependent receptor [Aliiglaciecola sp. M165]
MKIHSLSRAVMLCLGCSSLSVVAQQNVDTQGASTAGSEEFVERINVTGSNIKGVDLEGAQPLVTIDAEAIRRSGATTLSELMQTIGQTRGGEGSFSTTQSGATSTSTPAGQSAASLRGLGPSSTLTLINGRRVAASSFAAGTQNFVDINSIPLAAIEEIEILATGASATYGADAVAGVINYILKKDYDGAEVNVNYGNSFAGSDEGKFTLNAVWGGEVAGGQLTAFADFYDRQDFKATDRSFSARPLLVNSYSYLPKGTPNIYFFSARDGNEIGAPTCETEFVTTEFGEEICAYYGNEDDYLDTPFESFSGGLIYNKEFDNVTWNTDFFYTRTKSSAFSRPAPINQINDDEGPFTSEFSLDFLPSEVTDPIFDNLYIDPFDTPAGRELFGFSFDARFNTPRTTEVETNAFRLVSALSGEYEGWDWETAVTLSQSKSEQVATAGIYNRYKYHAAIAGELCSSGEIADYDADADTLNCSSGALLDMYNPFLPNDANNEAILAVAQEMPTRDGDSKVYAWDLRASGELFEFNGDFVMAAFGVDVRREEITDVPSENARARFENDYLVDVFGFGSSLSEAKRTQWGAFAELYVPINEKIDMQLAGRFDDYDDFGSTFNPKVALSYRPTESLILRASWATSFRAPSLTQAGVKLRTTTARYDCGANSSVSALYCEGDNSVRSENVLELGNPNLNPEESESVSVGFSFSPTEKTNITMDYWYFDHEDIVDTDMTGVLDRAVSDASLRHCGLVPEGEQGISYDEDLCLVTDAAGLTIEEQGANLTEILDAWVDFDDPRFAELPLNRDHVLLLENTGTQTVEGIDVKIDHTFELPESSITLAFDATHYLSFERNKPGSDEIEELIGTWRYPENIASLSAFWDVDNFFVGVTAFYTDSYKDDTNRLRGREIDELNDLGLLDENELRDVSSWTTLRLSTGYKFENASVRLSIDNLLDRDPPIAYGSSRGFDSINHNALGANYNLSLTYFF